MEAILELQNILIKDYYKEFIVSIYEEELEFNSYFSEVIIYRGEEYIEKDIDIIKKEIKYIIDDLKPLYLKAVSEVVVKLSNLPNYNDKINYLNYTIRLIKIPLNQLKKDFYIEDANSRYYTEPNDFIVEKIDRILYEHNDVNSNLTKEEVEDIFSVIDFSVSEMFQLEYIKARTDTITKLPFTLFTVSSSFINILNNKIDEINEEFYNKEAIKEKIEWSGKVSQLGFIFSKLAELDYLAPPKRDNGETNYTQFAKKVLNIFKIKTTEGTIAKYLNSNEVKAQETQRSFDKAKFSMPHKKEVS